MFLHQRKAMTTEFVIKVILLLLLLGIIIYGVFINGILVAQENLISACEQQGGRCTAGPDDYCLTFEQEVSTQCKKNDEGYKGKCCMDPEKVVYGDYDDKTTTPNTSAPEDLTTLKTKDEVQPYINTLIKQVWIKAAEKSGETVKEVQVANGNNSFALTTDYQYNTYTADKNELNRLANYRNSLTK